MDDLDLEEADNGFDFDESAFFKNIKIGDLNLDQIDDLVNQGEQDLLNMNGQFGTNVDGDDASVSMTPRQTTMKEMLMK